MIIVLIFDFIAEYFLFMKDMKMGDAANLLI